MSEGLSLSDRRRFAGDVVVTSLITLLAKLRGLLLLPLITRALGVDDYGIWVQGLGIVSLLAPFAGLNLYQSLIRHASSQAPGAARATFVQVSRVAAGVSVLVGLGMAAVAPWLSPALFGDTVDPGFLTATALLVPLTVATRLTFGHLRAGGRIKLSHAIDGGLGLVSIGLAAVLVGLGYGITAAVYGMVVAYAAFFLISLAMVLVPRVERARPTVTLREHLGYSIPTLPGSLFDWALAVLDRYILGIFWGAAVVGTYSACYSAAQLLLIFVAPFEFVMLPTASRFWDAGERDKALDLVNRTLRFFVYSSVPAAIALWWYGEQLLGALATDEVGRSAHLLMPPVLGGLLLWGVTRLVIHLYLFERNTRDPARVVAVAAAANAAACLVLVPRWGGVGAAWATLGAYALGLFLSLRGSRHIGRIYLPRTAVRNILCAAAAMCATFFALPAARNALSATLWICAGGIAYGAVLAALGVFRELRGLVGRGSA